MDLENGFRKSHFGNVEKLHKIQLLHAERAHFPLDPPTNLRRLGSAFSFLKNNFFF